MKGVLSILLAGAALVAPAPPQKPPATALKPKPHVFTGTITDDMCATKDGHSRMRMGPTDAECTVACVESHGSSFVLYDGRHGYRLSDQHVPEQFAGQRVRVTGTLDPKTGTISVDSIARQ